jgi:hypothetical protein
MFREAGPGFTLGATGHASHQPAFATHHDGDVIVVPDAELLFSGHFKRSGNDLVLFNEDRRHVVPDYFNHNRHPTLASPEGAALSGQIVELLAGAALPGQYAQTDSAPTGGPTPIGRVEKSSGFVTVMRHGVTVHLNVGDPVFKNDVVETGSDSAAGVSFIDGTAFSLLAHARMVLNEFAYDPNGSSNSAFLTLVQGTISFVAGKVAKTGDMKVDTPVAIVGIRGTAVEVDIPIDITATNGTVRFSVMVEPDGTTGAYDILDRFTGALLASVGQSDLVWLVSPTAPGQPPTIETEPKSPAEVAIEQLAVQQVFQYAAHSQQDPINPKSPAIPGSDTPPPDNQNNNLNKLETPYATITTTIVNISSFLQFSPSPSLSVPVAFRPVAVNAPPVFDHAVVVTQIVTSAHEFGGAASSFAPSISADGQFVVFEAASTLPGTGTEQSGPSDVFIYDRTSQTVTSLTVGQIAAPAGETYSDPSISLDGNFVVFQGDSEIGEQSVAQPKIYVYDRSTNQTTLLTAPTSDDPISGSAAHISEDGQFIVMQDAENGVLHVLVLDRNGTVLDDISSADGVSNPNISANGRFVTFWSTGSEIDVTTANGSVVQTASMAGGTAELYVFDRVTDTVRPVAILYSGSPSNAAALAASASMSADGRYIVFASDAENPLAPSGNEAHSNIFIFDQTTGEIRDLSIAIGGGTANGDSVMPQISADGLFVTFGSSASNLVAGDTKGEANTFLYNLTTNTVELISATANGVTSNGDGSLGSAVSSDGIVVSFGSSASNNSKADVYGVDESGGTMGTVVDDSAVQTLTTHGTLLFSGTQGDTFTVSVVAQAGALGTLSASIVHDPTSNGSGGLVQWTYQVAETQAAALAAGQSEVNTFSLSLDDGDGGVTSQNVTVTIIGTRPLVAEPIFWTNGGGGDFDDAANWSSFAVPGAADQVLIDHTGTYTVTSASDQTIATLDIVTNATLSITAGTFFVTNGSGTDNAGTIAVGSNATFEISGAVQNSGTIQLDQNSDAATFLINGYASLSGGGTVSLTDQSLNTISGVGEGATLENIDNTISGSGLLGNGSLALINDSAGTIDATGTNHQLIIDTDGSFFSNSGVVEATGPAGILIQDTSVNNNNFFGSFDSSTFQIDGAVDNTFLANIEVGGPLSNDAATFSATLVTNENFISVNDQSAFTADNLTNGGLALLDLGVIQINDFGTVRSDVIINFYYGVIEVHNNGNLYDGSFTNSGFLYVYDDGTVHNAVMDNSVDVFLYNSAGIFNTELVNESAGFITLSNFSTMDDGNDTNSGQITLYDNAAVVDNVLNNTKIGYIDLYDNAVFTITGNAGTSENAGSIFIGDFTAGEDTNFNIGGTFDNSGYIELDGSGYASQSPRIGGASITILAGGATLEGGGQIALLGGVITGAAGGATLTNVDNTISGFGNIGDGSDDLTLVNKANGVIDGDNISMTLDTGSNLISNAGTIEASFLSAVNILSPITSAGTLQAISHARLNVEASLDNFGTVAVSDGSSLMVGGVTTNYGTIAAESLSDGTIQTNVDNYGVLEATAGGTLELLSDVDSTGSLLAQDGNVIVVGAASGSGQAQIADGILEYDGLSSLATNFDTGAVGGLKLAHSAEFSGTVTGFAPGDYYDLMDIGYSQTTSMSIMYVSNAANTGGTLYVSGGGNNAAISMAGQYTTGSFFASSDGNGGTYISETMQVHWLSAVSGVFDNSANWDSGLVPNSADDVFLTASGEDYTVTVTSSSAQSVNSVSVGADATLAIGVMGDSSTFTIANGTEFGSILGQVAVTDGSELALHFQVQNSGVITLNSTGDDTTLSIIGTTTLEGGGQVVLSDSENNIITGATANASLINVDNTISGSGLLGDGQLTLVNSGEITASGEMNPLVINTEGNVVINNGTLEATGAAGLVIENTTVDSSGGGLVGGGGGPVDLQSAWLIGGTLNGQINVIDGLNTLDGTDGRTVTIDATGDVALLDGQQLTLRGSIGNSGVIGLGANGDATTLLIDTTNVSLSGGGTIDLSDNGDNIITGAAANATLTNVNNTIVGSGELGNDELTLVNGTPGIINADSVTPLVVDTQGNVATNDGTFEATNGGRLTILDTTVDGSGGGFIEANGASSLVELRNADLQGGTLATSDTGVISAVDSTFDGTQNKQVNNTGDVVVSDGHVLTLLGVINNTGNININASGDDTILSIGGSVTLDKNGEVMLSDDTHNIVEGNATGATLTNVANTISGSGLLGDGQLTLINDGMIIASGDTAALIVDTQGNVLINNGGTLEATGTAGLVIQDTTVDSSGDTSHSGPGLLGGGGGTIELRSTWLIGGLLIGQINVIDGLNILDGTDGRTVTIDATGDVTVLDGQQLTLRGSISNGGVINLDSSGDATTLLIDTTNVSLSGGSTIDLSDNSDNIITGVTANATLTNLDNTISGSGLLGDGQLTLINDGTIIASGDTAPLVINTQGNILINNGTLEATGTAGLVIQHTTVDSSAGGLINGNGGTVDLQNADLQGGTLETSGGGMISAVDSTFDGTLYAVTNDGKVLVNDGDQLVLSGTINNTSTGAIVLESHGDATTLEIGTANATLEGGGQITLSDDTANLIIGLSANATLTNGNNTIVGSGELGNGELTVVNGTSGIINADNVTPLVVDTQGNVATNDGIFEASDGGQLVILDTTVDGSGGGFIEANGANSLVELQNADLLGGSLATSDGGIISAVDSTFDGTQNKPVNNTGDVVVSDGHELTLLGIINNTGEINLNATGDDTTLSTGGAVTLKGGGNVVLSDDTHNIVDGNASGATLTNQDNTISGAGSIGGSDLTLINQEAGRIETGDAAALNLDFQDNAISNAGELYATGTGVLNIQGDVQNASSGLIEGENGGSVSIQGDVRNASSGAIAAYYGNVSVSGDVTGGTVYIADGTFEASGALSANVTFQTPSGTLPAGTLKLDAASMFTGEIFGFTGNGTLSGSDQIDLTDINETAKDFSATYDTSTGILSVTDGTNAANLKFFGTYSQDNFQFAPDGDGGTIVYDPPIPNQAKPSVESMSDSFVFHSGMDDDSVVAKFTGQNDVSDKFERGDLSMHTKQLMLSIQSADGGHDCFIDVGNGHAVPWMPAHQHAVDFILH